jgi:hypothetical protein
VTDQFGSFEMDWSQLAEEAPEQQEALEAWAQSTDGRYNYLAANTSDQATTPAGSSTGTVDPAGTYSGAGATLPTPAAAGTYIPGTGAKSATAQIADPAGTYSDAGASAPTTDPAGTYSGPGASAPTLAAAGTYIPVTGATSAASEIVDPAGAFSPAGANAPTIDPAGTYSGPGASGPTPAAAGTYIPVSGASSASAEVVDPAGAYSCPGASAPTLAAAGTYIPVNGATSTAAEFVDPAGTYSGTGASAPTLAQPGYYVPTAGASSETPVSPGYYQPFSGATTEFLALPPVISGTVAGQSTASGQPDTPFGSVTITDPNIETADTLSIQLTGSGALSDSPGFNGLTTIAPGLYTLSGTAAAITSELNALVFTPSASSGTTTFTLTDATSLGTSAVDATTTVTVSTGPVVVSVSTFLADQPTLDQTAGGFDIVDVAGAITANLDQLDDPNIDAITISDDGQVSPSVQQLTTDETAIGKLQNANLSPVLLAIIDTAADDLAGWSTLVADTSEIASITAPNGPIVVSTSTFLADQSTLDKILGGFDILDGAGAVTANLGQLSDPNIDAITVSDNAPVGASVAQLTIDATAIGRLQDANGSPVQIAIDDTAANIEMGLATLVTAASEIASITASNGPVAVSTSTLLADRSALDEVSGGFDIVDVAAAITAKLDQLCDPDIDAITISDNDEVGSSVQQLTNDLMAISELQNANLSPVLLAINDTAADVLAGLSTLVAETGRIASITASNGPVAVSVATFLADQTTLDRIVGGYAISDTSSDVLQGLNVLNADTNVTSINLTDGGTPTLTVSIQQALNDTRALSEIASPHTTAIADSAADIELLTSTQASTLEADGYTSIASTAGPVAMTITEAIDLSSDGIAVTGAPVVASGTVAAMTALSTTEASSLVGQGYTLVVLDAAANIQKISATQIAALSARDVLLIEASDTNVTLSVAEAQSLEGANMTVEAPSGFDVTLTATAANISALSTTTIAGLPALGVSDIVSTNGSVKISLSVAQALALEGASLWITGPNGASDTALISDTAANLEALTASQIAALPAICVTGLVSTNANVSYTSAQTAAILSSGLNVSASGAYTVTENFANGNYSVYRGGELIQQKSVNPDGSYDVAYFDVTGKTYSSLEDIYNSAGTLQADAEDNVNGSGSLLLYASGLTTTSSAGSESVTVGSDTFAINPHSIETTKATSLQSETFVYGPGFGQDTLVGYLATGASHDLLQFSASMFGFSSGSSQTADAQELLSAYASGTTNTVITDLDGDTLTLNAKSIATLQNNLRDFKFT